MTAIRNPKVIVIGLLAAILLLSSCTEIKNMQEQPKLHDPYGESEAFGTAARDLDPNAIPVGFLQEDQAFYTGAVDEVFVQDFPMELTEPFILEGQRQYNAFCSPCHGYSGYGNGVVAQEGLSIPPVSFHDEVLLAQPVGYYYSVITNGVGTMYAYDARIAPQDRWAIIAYIRAMQLSENADFDELSPEMQEQFTPSQFAAEDDNALAATDR